MKYAKKGSTVGSFDERRAQAKKTLEQIERPNQVTKDGLLAYGYNEKHHDTEVRGRREDLSRPAVF